MFYYNEKTTLKENVIIVVTFESEFFMLPYINSLYKYADKDKFSLIIFDNSLGNGINPHTYMNYNIDNMFFFDNKMIYDENKNIGDRKIINFDKIVDIINQDVKGSIQHCMTVHYILELLTRNIFMKKIKSQQPETIVKNVILTDADVIFRKNPFDVVCGDVTAGTFDSYSCKNRLIPCFQYFNLEKYKEYKLSFFDRDNMYGSTSNNVFYSDTGCAFYKQLKDKGLSYKEIDYFDYVDHFGSGSFAYNTGRSLSDIMSWILKNKENLL